MIDTKEVRAGNWIIKFTGTDINTQSLFEYKVIEPGEHEHTFAKNCFPIKITSSILGKIGFKHEFGDWYINRPADGIDEGLPFLRYNHTDSCWYLEKVKLQLQPLYVHQLQNLFHTLSNEELDIQLGDFENSAMLRPIDFFVKPIEKNYRTRVLM